MNRAGIAGDSQPASETVAAARRAQVMVCSDFPRSIESAGRLVPGCQPRISPLFREVGLPLQEDWNVRLPLTVWDYASRWLWMLNCIQTNESIHAAMRRAREAARELTRLAEESGHVFLVGHGGLNALLGLELRRRGWSGPRRATDDHWGLSTYQRNAD